MQIGQAAESIAESPPRRWRIFSARQWRGATYLVSPFWDFMLAGGAAVILLLLVFWLAPVNDRKEVDADLHYQAATLFALLAYVVNYPHFMASYHLMYRGFCPKLVRFRKENRPMWRRFLLAGVIVPVLMAALFIYGFFYHTREVYGGGIAAMYFFVGWHYVKQSFGVCMVLSAQRQVYFSRIEHKILYLNAYLVWMYSWFYSFKVFPGLGDQQHTEMGFTYTGLAMETSQIFLKGLEWAVYLYLALIVLLLVARRLRGGGMPGWPALAGYVSMYVLLLWGAGNPVWSVAVPFFHSAQYLLFIYAYKRGESSVALSEKGEPVRETLRLGNKIFILTILFAGLLSFEFVPHKLEELINVQGTALPIVLAFTLFLNIHHYFIDNAVWKKDNADVGRYLFHHD